MIVAENRFELLVVEVQEERARLLHALLLKARCALDEHTLELLKLAMADLNLSARAYDDRILEVARTIADLAGTDRITSDHVSEAVQLRSLDRQVWG